jgi:hypothetical protein
MEKAPFMGQIYIGDTLVDIHGYGRNEIEDAYIDGTDISVWEMIHALNYEQFKKHADKSLYGV